MTTLASYVRPMLVAVVLTGLATPGCANERRELASGRYEPALSMQESEIKGHQLTVDVAASAAAIQRPDGTKIDFRLKARDESTWREECSTQSGATDVQTFDLDPAIVEVGTLSLRRTQLAAGCVDKEVALYGEDETGAERAFVFTRQD